MEDTLNLDPAFLRKLERLSLSTRRPFAGQMKGEKRSIKQGTGIDFADYREYAAGDDLRYVDWNAAARTDRLYLKLFVEEEELFLALLIDTSKSMGFGNPSKLKVATQMAASLGYIGLCNYDRIMVQPYSEVLSSPLPVQRGRTGVPRLLNYLQKIEAKGSTDFSHTLKRYAASTKSNGLAIVFSDCFDEGWKDGMKSLLARGFQIVMVHILSEEETSPSLRGDLRILDSETGNVRELSVTPQLLERYTRTVTAFCSEIELFCHKYGMDYIRVSSNEPVESLILTTLRRVGLVR